MAVTEPIRDKKQLKAMGDYFLKRGKFRNYLLIVMGTYTALRISDLLRLRWEDVYDEVHNSFRSHMTIVEKKTGKQKTIAIHKQVIKALRLYFPYRRSAFLFVNNRKDGRAISRVQAWRIIREAATAMGLAGKISCHSLRKTWGYHAWTSQAVSPVVIMDIYNHSSYEITKRYLGVAQDDLDRAYLGMELF
ncbi:tyrosine-type recombinase/integrase [Candidatus Saccharibacteria bacterium]|nr:tyrosine-type recombinase/integrase [Candidatus Saccharibacteria bacterium]